MQLVGQESNLKIIDSWDKLPPFVIIQGDEHSGKTYLTLYLCKKFKLHYIKIGNSVNEVRQLIHDMTDGSNMLYHFDNFHTASLEAKNALLKVTEEPKVGNYIVITGGPQIKTLESRAKRLIMAPFTDNEIKSYLDPYFEDKDLQDKMIKAGINTPAKVEYYKSYERIEPLINFTFEIVNKITYITPENIMEIMARFENRYDDVDAALLFITMLINLIELNVKTKQYYSYNNILQILLQGKNILIKQPTLKRKLLLYRIFYKIYESNKRKD